MSTQSIIENLKDRARSLREELDHIEGLLDLYGANGVAETETQSGFTPIIPNKEKKSQTLTSKTKNGIKKLVQHPLSYQKQDLKYNLQKMGVEVTDATLNTALRALRDEGDVKGYRINRSNQMVFYISKEGVDRDTEGFPVKEAYRPESVKAENVDEFEILD